MAVPPIRRLLAVGLLIQVGLVLVHELTYAVVYGVGPDLAPAMRAGGHDGYWTSLAATAGLALTAGVALVGWQIVRLSRHATGPDGHGTGISRREVRTLAISTCAWSGTLVIGIATLYLVLENVESVSVGLGWMGIGVHRMAIPSIVFVATTMGLILALIGWRRAVHLARLRAARRAARGRAPVHLRPRATTHRPRATSWTESYAGRAPPLGDASG